MGAGLKVWYKETSGGASVSISVLLNHAYVKTCDKCHKRIELGDYRILDDTTMVAHTLCIPCGIKRMEEEIQDLKQMIDYAKEVQK